MLPNQPRDLDQLLWAISKKERRYILLLLYRKEKVKLPFVVDWLAENGIDEKVNLHGEDVFLVKVKHSHLPILEEVELVSCNWEDNLLSITPKGKQLVSYFDETPLFEI